MPNPDLTQQHRVGEILTSNRPEWSFGLARSGNIGFRLANLTEFWPKFGWISLDLVDIPPDLSRSRWICGHMAEIT